MIVFAGRTLGGFGTSNLMQAIDLSGEPGDNQHLGIVQVLLNPPYSSKNLTSSKTRVYHGMVLWNDQIFVLGGWSLKHSSSLDTVETYDIVTKNWKQIPSLPFKISDMATVIWNNNIVIVGGYNEDTGDLDTVCDMLCKLLMQIMYVK